MFANQEAELSLNVPCKSIETVRADKSESRFVVGSCSIREANQLTVVRFHPEMNELGVDGILDHPTGPVGVVCSCPSDKSLVLTCAEASHQATLWRMPSTIIDCTDELDYNQDGSNHMQRSLGSEVLQEVATLDHDMNVDLVDMVWRDDAFLAEDEATAGTGGQLVTLDIAGQLTLWDVSNQSARSVRSEAVPIESQLTHPRVALDPHHAQQVAITVGPRIQVLDWRADTSVPSGTVSSFKANRYGVTDIDYNPNKPYVIATAGQDGIVKYWDMRAAKSPLLVTRGGHSHYVTNVQYNPFHDQLVVSTGTDSVVNLWRVSTISSSPLLTLDEDADDNSETSGPNARVGRYEHADSVYDMTWGSADAWVYATVGFDGKVILNHVPSQEKYKILL